MEDKIVLSPNLAKSLELTRDLAIIGSVLQNTEPMKKLIADLKEICEKVLSSGYISRAELRTAAKAVQELELQGIVTDK